MNRILCLLAFIGLSFSSFSQATYQGLLWEITGNGLEKPSYLYGTMHVSNKVAFHLSDSFYKAIESVDVVSLEINPETWMETMTGDPYVADNMGNAFSMRGNNQSSGFYKSVFELKEPKNKDIGAVFGSELGILNSLLYRTSNYTADFQEDTYLDLFIYQAGKKQGKEITGLELLGTTMRLNEEAAKPEKDKDKIKANREKSEEKRFKLSKILDGRPYGEVMEDAYRQGDLDLLDSMSRLSGANDKYHDLIIILRNVGMAEAMDSIMQQKSLFAGIGAAHLPNSYGVINLLREMGYTVTQVKGEKSDFGTDTKERLESTFITQNFKKQTSFDGSFSTSLPGPLYEFPEAGSMMMAAYPDMANGATYVITRVLTYAPLHDITQEQYMAKLDSLFFENIPGKIETKEKITIDGVPGFDILNKTKKGDYQRYRIMVREAEILVFKAAGKKEFIKRPEVDRFFSDITFHQKTDWKSYSPQNTAYEVDMPGTFIYEGENNAFLRGFWKKNVQSYHTEKGHFMVLNKSLMDLEYMEEDDFELEQITLFFAEQFGYTLEQSQADTHQQYSAYTAMATKEGRPALHTKAIAVGPQYYLLVAYTTDESAADRFLTSISFKPYTFQRPFKLTQDSARLFSVVTNVEVPREQNGYYNYYNTPSDEDDTHLSESKTATYYSKESDETIYARMYKYHKYFYENEVDSLWVDYKKQASQENLFIRSEKKEEKEGIYTYELELGDTGSGRNILIKHILKGGIIHSLFTENDYRQPKSAFVEKFYSSFTPYDTAWGTAILQNKVSMFLSDLISDDSLTLEAAHRSWDEISFENEDAPKLIGAYDSYKGREHGLSNRISLLDKLGYLEHPSIVPFVDKKLMEVEDTAALQLMLLEALTAQRTKQSTQLFKKVLLEETPLSGNERTVRTMFMPMSDSLRLAKDIYPDVLMLSSLEEYRNIVYEVLAKAQDSGVAKKKWYKTHVKQMAWEANNAAKRQQAEESSYRPDFYTEESRSTLYGYDDLLLYYTKLLLPYTKNPKAARFFKRAEKLRNPGFKIDYALAKLAAGEEQNSEVWAAIAANKNDRIVLYQRLKNMERLDLFPAKYNTHDTLVLALYAQKVRVNQYKDSVVLVDKRWVTMEKDSGYMYFIKVKQDDDWDYGYIGLIDTTQDEVERWAYEYEENIRYSKYEDEELQLSKQVREYEMRKRPRYRVTDEKRFEDLKPNYGRMNFRGY